MGDTGELVYVFGQGRQCCKQARFALRMVYLPGQGTELEQEPGDHHELTNK